jgi:hypothetical protein
VIIGAELIVLAAEEVVLEEEVVDVVVVDVEEVEDDVSDVDGVDVVEVVGEIRLPSVEGVVATGGGGAGCVVGGDVGKS